MGCRLNKIELEAAWLDPHVGVTRPALCPIPRLSSHASFPSMSGSSFHPERTCVQSARNTISSLFITFSHQHHGTWGPALISSSHPGEGSWLGISACACSIFPNRPSAPRWQLVPLAHGGRQAPTAGVSSVHLAGCRGTQLVLNECLMNRRVTGQMRNWGGTAPVTGPAQGNR